MNWVEEMKDLQYARNCMSRSSRLQRNVHCLTSPASWDKVDQLKNALRAQIMLAKQLSKTVPSGGGVDAFPEVVEKIHDYDLEFQDTLDLYAVLTYCCSLYFRPVLTLSPFSRTGANLPSNMPKTPRRTSPSNCSESFTDLLRRSRKRSRYLPLSHQSERL